MQPFRVVIEGSSEPVVVDAESLEAALEAATERGWRVIGVHAGEAPVHDATRESEDAFLIPRDRLLAHLAQEGADIAYERIARDRARHQRIVAIITAVVGLVGFGSAAAIITLPIERTITAKLRRNDLRTIQATADAARNDATEALTRIGGELAKLDDKIKAAVDTWGGGARSALESSLGALLQERVGAISSQVNSAVALSSLLALSQKLGDQQSFTNELRDETMKMIADVVKHEPTAALPGFRLALEEVVVSFASADLSAELDRIDDLAHAHILKSQVALSAMALHYGQQLAGHKAGAAGWQESTRNRFNSYMSTVRDAQVPAQFLPLELLVLFMQQGQRPDSEGVAELVREPTAWRDRPKAQVVFHIKLISYCDARFWTRPGTRGGAPLIERRCRALIRSYQRELNAVLPGDDRWKARFATAVDQQLEELDQRAVASDDAQDRAYYLEARSVFQRYMKHMVDGGYERLVTAEGWE